MKKRTLLLAVTLICIGNIVFAQIKFQKTYGGANIDYPYAIQQTTDGGYIVVGTTYSFGAGATDIYLIRTNNIGDTLWTKTYGTANNEEGYSVSQTTDGGFIICGTTVVGTYPAFYVLKTDMSGGITWSKTYAGTYGVQANNILQTTDGGYIFVGTVISNLGSNDFYLVKTTANGDLIWNKTYGGADYDKCFSVQQTSDGGYIMVGFTESFGAINPMLYYIKINSSGNILWSKKDAFDSEGYSIDQTSDGGYIIAGSAGDNISNSDVLLIKTNQSGTIQWRKHYGNFASTEHGVNALQTADGGYIISGYTNSPGSSYIILVKTDGSGDVVWSNKYGQGGQNYAYAVQKTSDSGYIIAASTKDFGAGLDDVYLIKVDGNGNSICEQTNYVILDGNYSFTTQNIISLVDSGCNVNTVNTVSGSGAEVGNVCGAAIGINDNAIDNSIKVSPNPFTNELLLNNTSANGEVSLTDISGKEILKQKNIDGDTKINTENLSSGFYILHYNEKDKSAHIKVTKY